MVQMAAKKGMRPIVLILIGTVPTAYALNRALPEKFWTETQVHIAGHTYPS